MWQYAFFQHALIGALLICVLCGMVGTYIVTRRLLFVSGGITHASLGGVGLGIYLGIPPVLTAAAFAVGSALGIQWLSQNQRERQDSAISLIWTMGMSIGIMLAYLTPGYGNDLTSFLFGNILMITQLDIILLLAVTILVAICFIIFFKPIIWIAFDAPYMKAQYGRCAVLVETMLMVLVALAVVASVRLIGIVLVMSMLTIPQMTANLFTKRFATMMWLSMPIGLLSCIGGFAMSFYYEVPCGASIVAVAILQYGLVRGVRHLIRK